MNDTASIIRSTPERRRREHVPHPRLPADEKLAAAAGRELSDSSYFALRSVSCECHERVLVLRGKVPSFYLKQLAQEIVRKMEGVGEVLNALEVGE